MSSATRPVIGFTWPASGITVTRAFIPLIIDLGQTTVHGPAVVSGHGSGQDQAAGESFPFLGTTSVVVGHR
jgi:hypothetical protein